MCETTTTKRFCGRVLALMMLKFEIGSRLRPPDANNCCSYLQCAVASNGCYDGNHIMADMSGSRWDATTQVSSKSVHCLASYSVSYILQYGGPPY